MAFGVDEFLDTVRAVLIAEDAVPELVGNPELADGNVQVWHHGENDTEENIRTGINKCKGVHALVFDIGGDSDPDDAASPVIASEVIIELYVATEKRNRKLNPDLRLAGQIRDDIMQTLHLNKELLGIQHSMFESRIKGYKAIADAEYVAWRITLSRSIYLHS